MNVIGSVVTVAESPDPTLRGRTGTVVLETMNTLVLKEGAKKLRVAKAGSVFSVNGARTLVRGEELTGRLEDRWGAKGR